MSTPNLRKRWCDFKYLIKLLEDEAKEIGVWTRICSILEAQTILRRCIRVLEVNVGKSAVQCRINGLQWLMS